MGDAAMYSAGGSRLVRSSARFQPSCQITPPPPPPPPQKSETKTKMDQQESTCRCQQMDFDSICSILRLCQHVTPEQINVADGVMDASSPIGKIVRFCNRQSLFHVQLGWVSSICFFCQKRAESKEFVKQNVAQILKF